MLTIKDIEKRGLVGYKYISGSYSQNLYVEGVSDMDYRGIYFAPYDDVLGLGDNYQEEINDIHLPNSQ